MRERKIIDIGRIKEEKKDKSKGEREKEEKE